MRVTSWNKQIGIKGTYHFYVYSLYGNLSYPIFYMTLTL